MVVDEDSLWDWDKLKIKGTIDYEFNNKLSEAL